jgi:hypothetical protein
MDTFRGERGTNEHTPRVGFQLEVCVGLFIIEAPPKRPARWPTLPVPFTGTIGLLIRSLTS